MSIPAEPDRFVQFIPLTFTDPRVAGRADPQGARFCLWVDASTARTYPMVKTGEALTDWAPAAAGVPIATADIEDLAVTTGKINDLAVTTGKLNDLAVTVGKIAAAVTATIPGTPTLTPAAQVGSARAVAIQLKDIAGTNLAAKAQARVWLSDTAGGAPTASAPDGGVAVTDGTEIAAITAGKVLDVVSTAAGLITVELTHEGADTTWFVNVAIGNVVASSAAVLIDNA